MVRRGLQILILAITALGAAPCLANFEWPQSVVLQNFTNSQINGLYVQTTSGVNGQVVLQRYDTDPNDDVWYVQLERNTNTFGWWAYLLRTGLSGTGAIAFGSGTSGAWPVQSAQLNQVSTTIASGSGLAVFYATPPSEYEVAFPDWESASVLIPLGFGFGMMFWASALALHVPMKWVRSLADAAS